MDPEIIPLPTTVHIRCLGPDCFNQDPHAHQHWNIRSGHAGLHGSPVRPVRVTFLGNFGVSYSSESHHAASLEGLGHTVVRLQEGEATGEQVLSEASQSDLLVVVHTHDWQTPGMPLVDVLNELSIPTVTYHLDLWLGLQRQRDLDRDPFYRSIGWFFTADRLMADWFNDHTAVKGRYLPAAVFGPECYIAEPDHPQGNDVIFVGSRGYHPEWSYRGQLIDWLRETYGPRFTHVGGDGDTGTIRGHDLNRIYASSKVVVGDTLCLGFDYPDYWSDRVYETLGRAGGPLIHPYIKGMERTFKHERDLIFYEYGDLEALKYQIDKYLDDSDWQPIGEKIRANGHELVKAEHTYAHRWQTILDTVFAA